MNTFIGHIFRVIIMTVIIYHQFFMQPVLASPANLKSLIEEGLKNNPGLKAAKSHYEAMRAVAPRAGSLPDPIFKIDASNLPIDSWALDRTPMSGIQLALAQKFPFPGKQGLAKRVAERNTDASEQMYKRAKLKLIKEIKSNYYQLYYLVQAQRITRQNQDVLRSFTEITASKYSVGKGLQQDVLKSQVELSKISEKLLELKRMEKVTRAWINTLLNRDPDYVFSDPEELVHQPVMLAIDNLEEVIAERNPDIKKASYLRQSANAKHRLAKRGYWPDFTLGVGYRIRDRVMGDPVSGTDFVSLSLSFNLPIYWWKSEKAKVAEEYHNFRRAEHDLDAVKNRIDFALRELYHEHNEYAGDIKLYEDAILPQARQSLESVRTGYQVDKVDFLTLLNSQVTLYKYEVAHYRAIANYYKTIAGIEEIVGEDLM